MFESLWRQFSGGIFPPLPPRHCDHCGHFFLHAIPGAFYSSLHRREAGCSRRSNSLEALVWEKEAEVDRQRDRWPMSMLVSRVRLFNQIEENKPKDLIGALSGERKTNQEANQGVSLLAEVAEWRNMKKGMAEGPVQSCIYYPLLQPLLYT